MDIFMSSGLFGLGCLLIFTSSQALRDVFFGNVFQSVSFFVVAILAFGGSTVIFGSWSWWRNGQELRKLFGYTGLLLGLNIATAMAWIMYFFALRNLEPAVVSTLYTGIGAAVVLALSNMGFTTANRTDASWFELVGHAGVLLSLAAIAVVVLTGHSGFSGPSLLVRSAAVTAAVTGGVLIAIGHMIARRLGDLGIGSVALMGFRFPLTLGLAIIAEFMLGQNQMRPEAGALPLLAVAAFGLIAIPSFFLQLGIAATSPLTVNVMRALGPIFVFGAQQYDNRLELSGASLTCILAFAAFQSVTSLVRAWREAKSSM
jgi:drug/metabolite transporter (DMT)-like permease